MRKYGRILVATDFSAVSEIAAAEGVELADRYGAELIFLHVVEHFPEHLPHYRIAHEGMDPQQFIIDRAEKDLAAVCKRLGKPDAIREVRLTAHSAKAEIVQFTSERGIGLIVIGARGRRGLIEIMSGSTATGVVRAALCDVLVIRDQADAR